MPDRYELVIARRFFKDLRKIDPHDQERILEALREIDWARQYVDDIFVPGDEFATGVFRTMIRTRLRQAREYVESDEYASALERLYLAEHDARDPSALGGEAIAEHCQEAIRIVRALR